MLSDAGSTTTFSGVQLAEDHGAVARAEVYGLFADVFDGVDATPHNYLRTATSAALSSLSGVSYASTKSLTDITFRERRIVSCGAVGRHFVNMSPSWSALGTYDKDKFPA